MRLLGKVISSPFLNAILFLYKHVLDMPLNGYIEATRSNKRKRLPTVLNQSEISRFFQHISGTNELMAKLSYGAGLRLMECIRLRVRLSQKIDRRAALQTKMLPLLNISAPFFDRTVADYLYRTATRRYPFSTIRDTFGYRRMPENCSTYDQ